MHMTIRVAQACAALVLPVLVAGVAYGSLLGFRTDYLGHFAAGYGATLGSLVVFGLLFASERHPPLSAWVVCGTVVLCIGGGAILEETIFNLAQFDVIDFCNQSLGAVLAGFAFLMQPVIGHRVRSIHAAGLVLSLVIVYVGFRYAFA